MGGVGVPQGAGSSMGFGGGGYANTQQAVMGADNKLEAYNPDTMARTLRADPTPLPAAAGAGMTTQGVPDYVSNWLAQGGKGAMPTGSQEAALGTSAALPTYADPTAGKHFTGAKKIVVPPKTTGTGTGAGGIGTPAGASANANGNFTVIPMNAAGGYNQPGMQQSMAVSDQYNMMQGGSQQIASPPKGYQNSPQIMGGPIYSDGAGGYYGKGPDGTMQPLTGLSLQAAKGMFDSQGYGAQPKVAAPIAKKVAAPIAKKVATTKKVVKK